MHESIKVHVVDYGRKCLYLRYRDPMTGKLVTKSSEVTTRKEASKAAGKWEAELREGRYKARSKILWCEFRERYEEEVLPGLADATAVKTAGVFDAVERIVGIEKLASLTAERLSHLVKVLRAEQMEVEERAKVIGENGRKQVEVRKKTVTVVRAESTIKGHLATLKAALRWAKRIGMLHEVPSIDMPKRAKGSKMMRGRPVVGEEFDRLLAAVPGVVGEGSAGAWKWFLRGLWRSGLRLEESLDFWWDSDNGLSVDLSGHHPMLRIPAEHEKGNQDRLLPMAPEFAKQLLAVPEADRTGRVFKLPFTRKDTVSKVVTAIGTAAGVKVNTDPKTGKVKYASAHDLRRSFGARWARLVMPQILMELMRHESIETTMKFYVGKNAQTTADVLWKAVSGNTSGNSQPAGEADEPRESSQTIDQTAQ
jgi:integrase